MKHVPKDTPYCYTWKGEDEFYICPYYKSIPESNLFGICSLLKTEVEDQIKSCGIN